MGYAINVAMSMPMAVIMYMLTEKIITSMTSDNNFNEKKQKGFVMGFVIGLCFIVIGMTVFGKSSNIHNQTLQLAHYLAGGFLIINSAVFSWDILDDGSKTIILSTGMACMVTYSYMVLD